MNWHNSVWRIEIRGGANIHFLKNGELSPCDFSFDFTKRLIHLLSIELLFVDTEWDDWLKMNNIINSILYLNVGIETSIVHCIVKSLQILKLKYGVTFVGLKHFTEMSRKICNQITDIQWIAIISCLTCY